MVGDCNMFIFILILLLIMFSTAKMEGENAFVKDYLSPAKTAPIKGIFVLLIFLSHSRQMFELSGPLDEMYRAMQNHLGQMVVAMFLFYSGFGMMEQINRRGYEYVRSIPLKRLPKLLINFDLAVLLFLCLKLALREKVQISTILLSLIGWKSLGNSNWYIFVILVLYVFMYISFLPVRWSEKTGVKILGATALTALSAVLVKLLIHAGQSHWWYDTLLLFSLGVWHSLVHKPLERIIMRNDLTYYSVLACALIAYLYCYRIHDEGVWHYYLWAGCFTSVAVLATMKISFASQVLDWFGKRVFSIYILQRIPFLLLSNYSLFTAHKYAFVVVSLAITVPMAIAFDRTTAFISGKIWKDRP